MSDDMPELIDVADEAISESQPIEKLENEFKLVVSKRKRRQSKAEAIEADDDDDYDVLNGKAEGPFVPFRHFR